MRTVGLSNYQVTIFLLGRHIRPLHALRFVQGIFLWV